MPYQFDKNKCIFCFRSLSKTDICFESVDDTVDLTPDPVKLAYERRFDPNVDENDVRCWSRQPIRNFVEGDPEFDLDNETRIPLAWNEQRDGWRIKSRRRLCRFCHQRLPDSFGKQPNITIGLCGNTAAGKTVYMLSLIHDLRRVPNMSVTPDPVFYSELDTDYESLYNAMYSSGDYILPAATNPEDVLSPLVLNCQYSRGARAQEFSITLFDMAGEGMRRASYLAKQAVYLENVAGVIYLKNPDYFPGMDLESEALMEHAYLPSLIDAITMRTDGCAQACLAITITKFDKVLRHNQGMPEFERLNLSEMFAENPLTLHGRGFDKGRAMNLNQKLYNFFQMENTRDQRMISLYNQQQNNVDQSQSNAKPSLFARLFGRKKKVKVNTTQRMPVVFFAASPLGVNAQFVAGNSNQMCVAPSGAWNVDPVLWIIHRCGFYPAAQSMD